MTAAVHLGLLLLVRHRRKEGVLGALALISCPGPFQNSLCSVLEMRFKHPTTFLIKSFQLGQCSLELGGIGQSQCPIDRGNQFPAVGQQVGPFCPKPVVKAWRVDKLIDDG
jgi:hypothetical protein